MSRFIPTFVLFFPSAFLRLSQFFLNIEVLVFSYFSHSCAGQPAVAITIISIDREDISLSTVYNCTMLTLLGPKEPNLSGWLY